MIQVNTNFTPYRMKIGRREPVNFTVELVNPDDEPKILTLNIALSKQLSFEKGGYKTEIIERIKELPANGKKVFYYSIFPKAGTRTQEQPLMIHVAEHYRDFNYVKKEYKKNLGLKVED
tara:strand:- start:1568 stop:1924 length:357 start_codon:yes stop_codon:yes gene_type:complete